MIGTLLSQALDSGKYLVPLSHLQQRDRYTSWQYRHIVRWYIELLWQTQSLSANEFRLLQQLRLRKVLRAAMRISWWQKRLSAAGIWPDADAPFDAIKAAPVVRKAELLALPPSELCIAQPSQSLIWRTTTGTDGAPLVWAQDMRSHFIEYAAYYLRSLEHFSFPAKENLSRKFFLMFNYPGVSDYYLSLFAKALYIPYAPKEEHLSRPSREERFAIYEAVRSSRPSVLYGAPSALWWFVELVENDKVELRPNLIVFSGEMMPKDISRRLKRVFSCPIRSLYGTRELGTIGFSCPEEENIFHLNSEHIYLEIIGDNGKECPPDTYGNLTMTSLTNSIMPLIRYQPGDTGRWVNRPCACRTRLPRFELQGRDSDFLLLPGGKEIPVWPLYNALFANGRFGRIYQYQIEQVASNAIMVRLIKRGVWTSIDSYGLKQAMEKKTGNLLHIKVQVVDSIKKKGRKHRPFIPFTP